MTRDGNLTRSYGKSMDEKIVETSYCDQKNINLSQGIKGIFSEMIKNVKNDKNIKIFNNFVEGSNR